MLKRIVFSMLVIVFLAFSVAAPVGAQSTDPVVELMPPAPAPDGTGELVNETPEMWFVELAGKPTVEGASILVVDAQHNAFRAQAEKAGLIYTERYSFTTLFNGFSVSIDSKDVAKLSRLPGVKSVYPVEIIARPQTFESDINPDLFSSINMIGADVAQSELGFTGAGVKVAVMDTGIDVNHPAFGGDGVAELDSTFFYSSPRILYGYDFVGNDFDAEFNPVPVPDDIPDDCGGHGTHVAGIIGANDATNGMKGVAPDVTFGAYRVFGCEGSTTADVMIAAMERVLADGMDVLNMSIGSAYQWPQYPTAVAADRLVKKGVVVVASIGNSGATGLYSAGSPGLGKDVIGVASFDNTDINVPYFTVNAEKIGYIPMTFSPAPPTSGGGEIVDVGLACDPLTVDITGKVALAARGTCAFGLKAQNSINAGAIAVIISNNVDGLYNGTLGAPLTDPDIPVVGISLADGTFIRAQTAPIMMTWTDQIESTPSPTGGLISEFSSYGLSPDLALKPDIGAPGGDIYSSYPLELGAYAAMGGTSMASPHVAGAAALLLQAKPNLAARKVRDVLLSTAEPQLWWALPELGFLDNVHRQGAGLLQIDKAILGRGFYKIQVRPSKISAGESEAGPYTTTVTVKNWAPHSVTYTLDYVNALSTFGTINPSFYTSDASVDFSRSTLTVPAKSKASFKVTINPATKPLTADYGQYGGYITLTPTEGDMSFSIPFAGYVGDYQDVPVLYADPYGLPYLVSYYSAAFPLTDPSEWTFSMQGDDIPFFWVNLNHQSKKMLMKVYEAETDKPWGVFFKELYLPRNESNDYFYEFAFDGITSKGIRTLEVPDGTYYAVIKILKANGNPGNPDHWDTWTSPAFVIDRP